MMMFDERKWGRVTNEADASARAALLAATVEDVAKGLAPAWGPARSAVARLAGGVSRRFVDDIVAMDGVVGERGLAAGAEVLLREFSGPVRVSGVERVPASGSLLVAANHPGTVDTPLLWSVLAARPDQIGRASCRERV